MSYTSIEKQTNSMPYTSIENKRTKQYLHPIQKIIGGRGETQLMHVEDFDTVEETDEIRLCNLCLANDHLYTDIL